MRAGGGGAATERLTIKACVCLLYVYEYMRVYVYV